jgi:hypothetical protein
MNTEVIFGIIRHSLTFIGGILVTIGYVDPSQVNLISGSLMSLIGLIWSAYKNKNIKCLEPFWGLNI